MALIHIICLEKDKKRRVQKINPTDLVYVFVLLEKKYGSIPSG